MWFPREGRGREEPPPHSPLLPHTVYREVTKRMWLLKNGHFCVWHYGEMRLFSGIPFLLVTQVTYSITGRKRDATLKTHLHTLCAVAQSKKLHILLIEHLLRFPKCRSGDKMFGEKSAPWDMTGMRSKKTFFPSEPHDPTSTSFPFSEKKKRSFRSSWRTCVRTYKSGKVFGKFWDDLTFPIFRRPPTDDDYRRHFCGKKKVFRLWYDLRQDGKIFDDMQRKWRKKLGVPSKFVAKKTDYLASLRKRVCHQEKNQEKKLSQKESLPRAVI